jgi:hypothetical protein
MHRSHLVVATLLFTTALTACTDLKPLETSVADLKNQVARLNADVTAARQAAEQAQSSTRAAIDGANAAQSTANQASAAAQASQSCCTSTNEKIDRMFRRQVEK